ncbi:integrase [Sphingomonas sp. UYEF23]
MRVPDAVRPLLGRSEVRKSLGTASSREGRLRVARYATRVMDAFEMILTSQLSTDEARALVRSCFRDLVGEIERSGGIVPTTDEPNLEAVEQRGLSMERIAELQQQIATTKFDNAVLLRAQSLSNFHRLDLHSMAPGLRNSVLSGVARALVEQQKLFQLRIDDGLAPFLPTDPLFQNLSATEASVISENNAFECSNGPSVAEAIVTYLTDGRQRWVAKTYMARVWQLRFFEEHVGSQLPLSAVTTHHVRTFRDAVRMLHKTHGKRRGCTFFQRQTDNVEHRISDKTASIIFEPIKAFFRWAKSIEGLIATNPADGIQLLATKVVKGSKSRRPFTAGELRTLFSAPLYRGCKSKDRRYEHGSLIIKDAKFWIPILGYYTGARLGEIVQLHVRDVHLDGPIPYLSINEDNVPGAGSHNHKHVKSHAGVRAVPLHNDLIDLGFSGYVAKMAQKTGKGRVRLFEEFAYGSDGQASTVASKWFARFMDSVGLSDPKLVYHSFRHNAEDAFRDALQPQYVIDKILGHSDGATSAGYGEGASLGTLHGAVMARQCKVQLPAVLQQTAKDGEQ